MTQSTHETEASITPPRLEVSHSNMESTSSAECPSLGLFSSSASSLGPPRRNSSSLSEPPVRDISRPLTPARLMEIKSNHMYKPKACTRDRPQTEAPKSFDEFSCPRTGSPISTSAVSSQGVPLGVRILSHVPPEIDKKGRGDAGRPESMKTWTTNDAGITAMLTSGPTLMLGEKACMLTATPIREIQWRGTCQAIMKFCAKKESSRFRKTKGGKESNGLEFTSLREYTRRRRAGSIATAMHRNVSIASLFQVATTPPPTIGRVWLCNMGCEGATGRKRDWALVELDPNEVGDAERKNVVEIDGQERELKAPSYGAQPGAEVILATAASRNTAVRGTAGEIEEGIYGYNTLQKITLANPNKQSSILEDGDAGACVVDANTNEYYGMLVMCGMRNEEFEARKKDGEKEKDIKRQSVAWFVPWKVMARDIVGTYPVESVAFASNLCQAEAYRREALLDGALGAETRARNVGENCVVAS